MKAPRRRFSPKIYRDILVKQAWRCACGCRKYLWTAPDSINFDHILPLWLDGKDEPENLQALFKGHHAKKTHKEASARAKVVRIQKQDGLRKKKPSKRDLVMEKILRVMT